MVNWLYQQFLECQRNGISVQRKADADLRMELGKRDLHLPRFIGSRSLRVIRRSYLKHILNGANSIHLERFEIVNDIGEEWPLLQSTLSGKEYSTDKVNLLCHRLEELPSVADVTLHEEWILNIDRCISR